MSVTRESVLHALSAVQDPDLGKDIVSLGFVKDVTADGGNVSLTIELTTPACPVKDQMRDQAIAANHSFYDCSLVEEYWDDGRPSARVYPLFPGLRTRILQYPIFSPCVLRSAVDFFDAQGRLLRTFPCDPVVSPSRELLEFPVTAVQEAEGLSSAVAFRFRAWAQRGGTPRRINHQIVYEDGAGRSSLGASVAISLRNPGVFTPAGAIMRLVGRDAMCRSFDAAARTYWVERDPPGPAETSFRDMF